MRTISLWQPWATLIAIGAKRVETRSWPTSYRGPLAIHAAKKWTPELNRVRLSNPFWQALQKGGWSRASELPRGCIVAVVNVIDCQPTECIREALLTEGGAGDEDEIVFGDYSLGRFGWLLQDSARALRNPIPWTGSQGFFEVPDELIKAALEAS